jgi:hypothetical protein
MVGALFALLYRFAYERAAKRTWFMLRREAGLSDNDASVVEPNELPPPSNER